MTKPSATEFSPPRSDLSASVVVTPETKAKGPSVATDLDRAQAVIHQFLIRAHKSLDGLTDDTGLWGDGLELDSLEAAELSVMLEDEFGTDPFSTGSLMPEKIGDILTFYDGAAQSA
jgi:acyl carrier protein